MLLTMLQLLLGTLLLTVATAVACTSACWLEGLSQSKCLGKADETKCMCSSETNYLYFYDCNLTCLYEGTFTGLNGAMECIGYKRDVLITSAAPASTATVDLPSPTTFETRVKRAPEAQIAALTPWQTQAPKPKPIWSSYTAASFPGHTIWYCGVPGAACGEKAIGSETQPDAFDDSDSDSDSESVEKRQVNISKLMSAIDGLAAAEAANTNLVGVFTYTGNNPRDVSASAPMAEPSDLATYGLPASITGTYGFEGDHTTGTEYDGHWPTPGPAECKVEGICAFVGMELCVDLHEQPVV
ncbi:hypothetical protein B0A55_09987 [Friedmanniomyces simplex]|uniref:Extracellular membrane protein CFEM domain-containing protein n=1 Tax=Friedmanniomyces simplex TaxID=329884 RepID=A0A4U0WGF6_9PEZI|nr:hypothetical protein B0A55_09987 [Friedmanniomyces simplex]